MLKKVGILFDNISNNTGDAAIGLSVIRILSDLGVPYSVLAPGHFNAADHETIVVGGGHILRPRPDPFYDRFRVPGSQILNAAGILGRPRDLHYLDDYQYLTVRSNSDREKLSYLSRRVHVVPCTTMLLDDLEDVPVTIKGPSIGVHLLPGMMGAKDERAFIKWASSLPYTIYFIPITHYNRDYSYMQKISSAIRNSVLLPPLGPLEIFTLMGKFDRLISSSLHGAIFAYAHSTPFITLDYDEKMSSFMEDRGLRQYLFRGFGEMKAAFQDLIEDPPDYGRQLSLDRRTLERHVARIKALLPPGHPSGQPGKYPRDIRAYLAPAEPIAVQPRRAAALAMRLNSICRSLDRRLHYGTSRLKNNIVRCLLPPDMVPNAPAITAKKR